MGSFSTETYFLFLYRVWYVYGRLCGQDSCKATEFAKQRVARNLEHVIQRRTACLVEKICAEAG